MKWKSVVVAAHTLNVAMAHAPHKKKQSSVSAGNKLFFAGQSVQETSGQRALCPNQLSAKTGLLEGVASAVCRFDNEQKLYLNDHPNAHKIGGRHLLQRSIPRKKSVCQIKQQKKLHVWRFFSKMTAKKTVKPCKTTKS